MMKYYNHLAQALAFFALSVCQLAFGDSDFDGSRLKVDTEKAWFKPTLITNQDSVCSDFLAINKKLFFPQAMPLTSVKKAKNFFELGGSGSNPAWLEQGFEPAGLEVEVNQTKTYIRSFDTRGCGGACEGSVFAISSKPFPKTNSYGEDIDLESNQYTDESPTDNPFNTGLFKHSNGNYYALILTQNSKLFKAMSNSTWELACEVKMMPTSNDYKEIQDIHKTINDFGSSVLAVLGEEGGTCGSMHTLSRWRENVIALLNNSLYGPWSLHESPESDSTYDIDLVNLEAWAIKDASNYKTFENFKRQMKLTTKELSTFYKNTYQWPGDVSQKLADKNVKVAVSAGIRFYEYEHLNANQSELASAILKKKSISEIKVLMGNKQAIADINLSIAVEYPDAMKLLLESGVDVNQRNEFNKSLLMYAAQYNQIETAKLLLAKGINPNLQTTIPDDACSYALSKSGMSALHYAVRYASADFVKLLLNSGADPFIQTSEYKENRPIDWLRKYTNENAVEKNTKISKTSAAELEKLLSLPDPSVISEKVEKLNLEAEQAYKAGQLVVAESKSRLAISLDEGNERALADLSLILMKQEKKDEALETIQKLLSKGRDSGQLANAWFNYGLICEKHDSDFIYNGNRYCQNGVLNPFVQSFQKKATPQRAKKIVDLIIGSQKFACAYQAGALEPLWVVRQCNGENFCVLAKNNQVTKLEDFKLLSVTSNYLNKSPKKVAEYVPSGIKNILDFGGYTLTEFNGHSVYDSILYGGNVCTENAKVIPYATFLK